MGQPDEAHDPLKLLRQRAEEALRGKPVILDDLSSQDIQYLLHELQVYQEELTLQNHELRRAQLELEAARDQYADLYDFAPAGYCTLDRRDLIVEANQTLVELIGVERKDIIDHKLSQFVEPGDQDEYYLHRQRAFEDGQRQVTELRMVRRTGERISVHLESVPDHRDPARLRVMLSDITGLKQAEAARRASEARLQLATEAANIGTWDWDLVADELTLNQRCKALFGRPAGAAVTFATILNAVHPGDRAKKEQLAAHMRATQELCECEYRVIWPDGSLHWVLEIGRSYTGAGGMPARMAGIALDISRQKANEQKLKENAAELAKLNHELQDFAFIASHDLQEPLRKIRAFGERLKTKTGGRLSAEEQDFVVRMESAAQRMQKMIDSLLAYSQVSTHTQPYSLVDLAQITNEVLSDLEFQIEQKGAKVEVGELGTIEADPLQMRLLLQNLIGNALKFSPPGVPPHVRVCSKAFNRAGSGEELLEISVEDHGIGFDMALAERLFQPFQRLVGRSEYAGNGVGLAICRKIVERHGGSIAARSTPGQGATFIVTLPVQR